MRHISMSYELFLMCLNEIYWLTSFLWYSNNLTEQLSSVMMSIPNSGNTSKLLTRYLPS